MKQKQVKEEIITKMTGNDEINENFTLTKQKKPGFNNQRSIDLLLRKNFEFNYVNTEHKRQSLPYPTEGCICGLFFKFFNIYDPDIRCRIINERL